MKTKFVYIVGSAKKKLISIIVRKLPILALNYLPELEKTAWLEKFYFEVQNKYYIENHLIVYLDLTT